MRPATISNELASLKAFNGSDPHGHVKARAMQVWFMDCGSSGGGQFVGDPQDSEKQLAAREAFESWWTDNEMRASVDRMRQ